MVRVIRFFWSLALRLMGFAFGLVLLATRRLLPLVIPLTFWVLRVLFLHLTFSIVSLWRGIPQVTHQIAEERFENAVQAGWPEEWAWRLYWVVRYLIGLIIVLEWVGFTLVTVISVTLLLR
jgi:hypothetical protein